MLYPTAQDWQSAPHKRVALFGMSGLGKTHISQMLRDTGDWFHYSVDYRIGTRYMGEHIVDNFKQEAMRNPFLRELLMTDSIYIASNISFENLSPLSTYLGKPGNPEKGGIPLEAYIARQRQHRMAEVAATQDAALFASKAADIYGYAHFICDCSGSLCEVVDAADPADPVMTALSACALPVWLEGPEGHADMLAERFDKAPKPMYYNEGFLRSIWADYLEENDQTADQVNPDSFVRWGYRKLLDHRLPRYREIAERWGIALPHEQVSAIRDAKDFNALITAHLPR